jgi:hypothetical protein
MINSRATMIWLRYLFNNDASKSMTNEDEGAILEDGNEPL